METRSPERDELTRLIDFLSRELRPEAGWSIADEYPHVFQNSNISNLYIMTEGEQFLSHAALKPLVMRTSWGTIKIATIGSVITQSEHRNKGYSTQVLESAIKRAVELECDLAVLWTNQYDFYRKMNFELAGYECAFEIGEHVVKPAVNVLKTTAQIDPIALSQLMTQHTCYSLRAIEDIAKFLKIPKTEIYTTWDANHKLRAYAVMGKGADLQNYAHEWGGSKTDLLDLLSQVRALKKQNFILITPRHSQNLNQTLIDLKCGFHPGHLGMIRILRGASFAARINQLTESQLKTTCRYEGDKFIFKFQDTEIKLSEREMVVFCFGKWENPLLKPTHDSLKNQLKSQFPLPLWVWGWDSI